MTWLFKSADHAQRRRRHYLEVTRFRASKPIPLRAEPLNLQERHAVGHVDESIRATMKGLCYINNLDLMQDLQTEFVEMLSISIGSLTSINGKATRHSGRLLSRSHTFEDQFPAERPAIAKALPTRKWRCVTFEQTAEIAGLDDAPGAEARLCKVKERGGLKRRHSERLPASCINVELRAAC